MIRSTGFIALLLSVLYSGTAGQLTSLSAVDTLLAKQEYGAANALLTDYLDSMPQDNKALYLRVAIEQTRILDYESYQMESGQLYKTADSVKKILELRLTNFSGRDSVRCLFYIATIDGCISVLQAKTGEIVPAMQTAIASVTRLNEVVRLDSNCAEAYMGIGLFHYYLNKSFTWLPFIDAESEMEGIKKIERATRALFPYDFAAKNSLCWVLMERKKFKRVDSLAKTVLSRFPDNTIFLRIQCLNAFLSKQFPDAVALGEKLSELSLKRTPVNWSDLVLAWYVISSADNEMGKRKEAVAAAEYILNSAIPQKYREIPHVKKNLRKIENVKKELKGK